MHIEDASGQIQALGERRDELRKVIKRVLPESELENAKAEIAELIVEIKNLRRELKVCKQIEERSGHVRENGRYTTSAIVVKMTMLRAPI